MMFLDIIPGLGVKREYGFVYNKMNNYHYETNKNEHWGRCRVASEIVYAVCKLLHLKGDFKINILQNMRGDEMRQRGHAWVTCNDRDLFVTPAHRPQSMDKIGENDKYCYWISVKHGRLKHRKDKNLNE